MISVHPDGHYLQSEDGSPFFWLGDTAWQLIHWSTREECSYYLRTRSRQGYTVIQSVLLSEFDGVNTKSIWGEKPLLGNNPSTPNPLYLDRVVEIVDEAASLGLQIALVPIWGDKLTAPWGVGPRLFDLHNLDAAFGFASAIGRRLRDRNNVIWLLGGDRPSRLGGMNNDFLTKLGRDAAFDVNHDWTPIWREVARGLAAGLGRSPLVVFHPQGGEASSSVFLHNEPWLSVNGMQSGHGGGHDVPVWNWISRDFSLHPVKPTIDLEPNYEDHAYNPWPRWDPSTGYFRDYDVRKQVYRSVFAGACGVTYGNHSVWSFATGRQQPVPYVERSWLEAMDRPAGRQMVHLRSLVESRPFYSRIPDQQLIVTTQSDPHSHVQATRDKEGSFAFVYFPLSDQTVEMNLTKLRSAEVRSWWYDPRSGIGTLAGATVNTANALFTSPPNGPDWVLVLDDPAANYRPPGL